ncbi:MAG TPA: VOC family protein [Micromonospora sp.]
MTHPPSAAGTPVAVHLSAPSVADALPFYRELLGWRIDEETGSATLDGVPVATVRSGPGPTGWLTVFTVDDLPAVRRRALAAGGTVPAEPPAGDAPLALADPAGAPFLITGPVARPGTST